MTIVEFLRARYDEDALRADSLPEHARHWTTDAIGSWVQLGEEDGSVPVSGYVWGEGVDGEAIAGHIALHDPARVLADVEAKRRIVDWCERMDPGPGLGGLIASDARKIARWLALPYASHPDYDPAWRLAE